MNCSGIKNYHIILLAFFFLLSGCRQVNSPSSSKEQELVKPNKLIDMNRALIRKDRSRIMGHIDRNKLKMTETGTGLWYEITQKTNRRKVKKGDMVNLEFNVLLLDGKKCYSSEKEGVKSFVVGQGGVESGLEEGILLLHEGENAKFIIPPHLAHGLTGDGNKIPARAIIIYNVELISIQ